MSLIRYNILRSYEDGFDLALQDLVHRMSPGDPLIRVVFFGNPLSQEAYSAERYKIQAALYEKFGDRMPVFSYLAQPPLGSTLVVETQAVKQAVELSFRFVETPFIEVRYAVVEGARGRAIFTGGIQAVDLSSPIGVQAREVLGALGALLRREELGVDDISRQWNYIERITDVGVDGQQHYQAFNDARSDFYSGVTWRDGYPAATGIGTLFGGVMVEVDAAFLPLARIVALGNSLQVSAHEYSSEVLRGSKILSTPKFERAKAVDYGGGSVKIYVSGTAAIRGEQSLKDVGFLDQTRATVENIDRLVSRDNLASAGVSVDSDPVYKVLRVYLKYRSDFQAVKRELERRFGNLPIVYVWSDVCREELLVEIEGVVEY